MGRRERELVLKLASKPTRSVLLASVGILAGSLSTTRCQREPQPAAVAAARLEVETERILAETGIPAISIALVKNGEVVWADAFGLASQTGSVAATEDTYFSTGSTLKPVLAAAIMQLVDAGHLSLEDSLNSLVGSDLAVPEADAVNLRHLLSHYSGLDGPVDVVSLWERDTLKTLEETLLETHRVGEPGVEYQYCNVCYAAAGLIIERFSGMSLDEYLSTQVFSPLGVEISAPTRPQPEVVERMALPYGVEHGNAVAIKQIRTNVFPAGEAYLRPKDMAAFLAAVLNGGIYRGHRILTESSAEELIRPQFESDGAGLGFNIGQVDGRTVVSKNGIFTGYHTMMMGDPATRDGAYVVANSTAAGWVVANLAKYALRLLRGEDPPPLVLPG